MQTINPFEQKPEPLDRLWMNWEEMYPRAYNKHTVDPYTKCRIVLMNGTEFEAQWFSRNFSRHCTNNDLRRELALIRRSEQQQQKRISCLKPKDENILEHTITYEQLAVDLTAVLAQQESDCTVKNALNFALLEDFDHLYRYANLLSDEYGVCAKTLVGGYTEITPARPTISEHRYPTDSIFCPVSNAQVSPLTKLNIGIITAAEQQTMNYYMNIAPFYCRSDLGRRLYQEIAIIEEEHVSQYESLKDPSSTWLEELLMHEYTECYLYYSCLQTECDPYIKCIWEECFAQELVHLHKAKELLYHYEHKQWEQVIPDGCFPALLELRPNIDYVREIIRTSAGNTQKNECVVPLCSLSQQDPFFAYQQFLNGDGSGVASHNVIAQKICHKNTDYRFEIAPNPVCELQNRRCDNTSFARRTEATPASTQKCCTTKNNCACCMDTEKGRIHF